MSLVAMLDCYFIGLMDWRLRLGDGIPYFCLSFEFVFLRVGLIVFTIWA